LPQTDEQLLQKAADAYQAVVADPKAPKESEVSARLGLAAVAENRKQWDQAKDQYQKIVDDPAAPKPLKDLAAGSLSRLEIIRKAPLIGQPATLPALATQPATTSTAPAATSTAPSTSTAPTTGDAKPQAAEVENTQAPKQPG
jgi:CCR4-NOT transcriptional regulation complex NOT5 subunit